MKYMQGRDGGREGIGRGRNEETYKDKRGVRVGVVWGGRGAKDLE